ncbi:hypothetical protein COI93_22720 [Bacillus cereus]|uniref:Uncharacterized protein n=1 Tax=Bacillus cereus TaxID=1396 RepID=A0A2B0LE54_BACCE|nr:hypothetical protein COI93_22720 [Bacillus cereus]
MFCKIMKKIIDRKVNKVIKLKMENKNKEVCVMIVKVNMTGLAVVHGMKHSYHYATCTER